MSEVLEVNGDNFKRLLNEQAGRNHEENVEQRKKMGRREPQKKELTEAEKEYLEFMEYFWKEEKKENPDDVLHDGKVNPVAEMVLLDDPVFERIKNDIKG